MTGFKTDLIALEARRRLDLLIHSYAYEIMNFSLISDHQFDQDALLIDTSIVTGVYDEWWRTKFSPHTGSWVWNYPDQDLLERLTQERIRDNS